MTSIAKPSSIVVWLALSALCWSGPAAAIDTVVGLEVPRPPIDEPCETLAAHGFFGIESRVVEAIGRFIRRQ